MPAPVHSPQQRSLQVSCVSGMLSLTYACACRYPQLIQNALLGSVVGISFDFMLYNWIGFICYSAFNIGLYLHPVIRQEYR